MPIKYFGKEYKNIFVFIFRASWVTIGTHLKVVWWSMWNS